MKHHEKPPEKYKRIAAEIVCVRPVDGGKVVGFESACGRLDIVLSDHHARWLGAALANDYKLFQS